MGPGIHVVQVLPKTDMGRYRGDRLWPAKTWTEALVDDELLALLKGDVHLDVRTLDASAQVYRGLKIAETELAAAVAAKETADARHKVALAVFDAAKARAGSYTAPPAFVAPTPMRDAAIAAGVVRAEVAPPPAAPPPAAAAAAQEPFRRK